MSFDDYINVLHNRSRESNEEWSFQSHNVKFDMKSNLNDPTENLYTRRFDLYQYLPSLFTHKFIIC